MKDAEDEFSAGFMRLIDTGGNEQLACISSSSVPNVSVNDATVQLPHFCWADAKHDEPFPFDENCVEVPVFLEHISEEAIEHVFLPVQEATEERLACFDLTENLATITNVLDLKRKSIDPRSSKAELPVEVIDEAQVCELVTLPEHDIDGDMLIELTANQTILVNDTNSPTNSPGMFDEKLRDMLLEPDMLFQEPMLTTGAFLRDGTSQMLQKDVEMQVKVIVISHESSTLILSDLSYRHTRLTLKPLVMYRP